MFGRARQPVGRNLGPTPGRVRRPVGKDLGLSGRARQLIGRNLGSTSGWARRPVGEDLGPSGSPSEGLGPCGRARRPVGTDLGTSGRSRGRPPRGWPRRSQKTRSEISMLVKDEHLLKDGRTAAGCDVQKKEIKHINAPTRSSKDEVKNISAHNQRALIK